MPIERKKTVWILGAGFSRAVGGPLLADLFRNETLNELTALFPQDQFPGLAQDMLLTKRLFNFGYENRKWVDAEAFMADIENGWLRGITDGGTRRDTDLKQRNILALANGAWGAWSHEGGALNDPSWFVREFEKRGPLLVRRALAAECSRFLLGPQTEIWDPYVAWLDDLDPNLDTILSFNYDCVVEMADAFRPERKVDVVMPWRPGPVIDESGRQRVQLFKLHGSTNWITDTDETDSSQAMNAIVGTGEGGGFLAALEGAAPIGIAAPGGAKDIFVQRRTHQLWDEAKKHLRTATEVVFLGYGFPATDERAKAYLLSNIGRETDQSLDIHLVLGSDISRPPVRRLTALLATIGPATDRMTIVNGRAATAGNAVALWPHAMGAEDFIRWPTLHKRAKTSAVAGRGPSPV